MQREILRRTSTLALAALTLALPRVARAGDVEPSPDPGPDEALQTPAWGLHSGDTVGRGSTLLYGEVGWPDVSLGFQRGASTDVDVGFRMSVSYGIDYVVPKSRANNVTDVAPGLGLTVPVRVTLARGDRVSLLVHADPGIKFDAFDPKPFVGPELPLGVDLGVHLSRRSTLTLGADLPLSIRLTPDVTGFVTLLMGLTFESRFTDRFGMSFNLRTGIVHGINKTGSDTDLGLLGQVGFFGRT